MTSEPPRSGLQPLSHLRAGPTTSSSSSVALPPPSNTGQTSRSPNRSPFRNDRSRDGLDPTSERATAALIRRVLCPQSSNHGTSASQPPEELLPPLTSSNEVDRELYAVIAIIVRDFVYSWYSTITSDQALVNEALQVIAHCTRALEQRLRHTDVAQLVLDEIPSLVETHIVSYRHARQQHSLSGLTTSTRTVYHAVNPHPAFSPVPEPCEPRTIAEQDENESIYRQLLVHGMLAVLLPTEDLENACVRTLVGDILGDLLMGKEISRRACEGWFIWDALSELLGALVDTDRENDETQGSQQGRLAKFGLLSTKEEQAGHVSPKPRSTVSAWIWSFLHAAYLTYVALRFTAIGLFRTASNPKPSRLTSTRPMSSGNETPKSANSVTANRPVLNYRLYSMMSQLLDLPRRMPWLTGMLALVQYMVVAGPRGIGGKGSVLDRFLHQTIHDHLVTPTLLPNLLRAVRAGLFPGNTRPIPTPTLAHGQSQGTGVKALVGAPHASAPQQVQPDPNPAEEGVPSNATTSRQSATPAPLPSLSEIDPAAAKRHCAIRILSVVPGRVVRTLLGHPDAVDPPPDGNHNDDSSSISNTDREELIYVEAIESDILDLFADEYCNKHLVYAIIELVLVRLLPELGERSVAELMEDRGVGVRA